MRYCLINVNKESHRSTPVLISDDMLLVIILSHVAYTRVDGAGVLREFCIDFWELIQ